VEYDERESEFDLEDEDKIIEAQGIAADDDLEVDVDGVDSIPAFCSSDEEGEDRDALMFLPIAPDIEDAEETWAPPPDPMNPTTEESHKRHTEHKENNPEKSKRKKPRTYDMTLENAPTDEVHPLLSNKPSKDKPSTSKKAGVGRPPSSGVRLDSSSKRKDRMK